jgi:signal transduction histidine kinase
MLATIEVAEAHPDRADLQRVVEVLGAESRRLSGLVDDLLLLAAHEERPGVVRQVPVDLEEILFAESDRLHLQGGLRISVAGVTAVRVLGDPRSLERAVRNLVDNAVRHASNTIALTLEADGFEAVLRVADDGDGVDLATAERLFERFTRSAEARDRPAGGAGLGLSIVAAVAAAHGGSVAFVGAATGTVIELRLPLSPEIAGGEAAGSSPRFS